MTKENKILAVGQEAPAFSALNHEGARISLRDFAGKVVVIYFYPKDLTSGCTKEACAYRDQYPVFDENKVTVLGVSPDSVASHLKFVEKHQLPFSLLADEDQAIAKMYGTWVEKSMYGRKYMGVERSTFVVDEEGKIAAIFRKVKAVEHVKDVLEVVTQKQRRRKL